MPDAGPPPGWYPDPGGRPGHVRYWDGRHWSSTSSPGPGPGGPTPTVPGRRPPSGWLLAGAGVAVVLAVALVVVIVSVVRARPPTDPTPPPVRPSTPATPASTPGGLRCAERSPDPADVPVQGGRVRSGHLSYPQLATPFSPPSRTTLFRFDYLHDVASQFATLTYHGSSTGGAEVMIARLPVADGFGTPQQVARVLYDCVRDRFPSSIEKVRRNQATSIDGHRAWIVRAHLGYGPPVEAGVRNEEVVLVVVSTAQGENGLFYADLPDTHPDLVPVVERALGAVVVS